ncbi:MAG: O-antigen ligase family protein [Candidatus Nitrospinota bacterium M3_3B_026]
MSLGVTVDRWDKAGWVFLLIFVIADFFSISAAQIAAAGMGVCWIGRWAALKQKPDFSSLLWPVAAFVAASLVSAALSLDPAESFKDSKDLLHLFILFAAYDQFRRVFWKADLVLRVAAGAGAVAAMVGLAQAVRRGVDIYDRISGFHGMYMTYAGLLMLAFIFDVGVLIFSFRGKKDAWIPPALALIAAALLLSLTRSAWIGAAVGGTALAIARKPVAAAVIPILAAVAIVLSPAPVKDRIVSMADMENESNRERLLVWCAGLKIIADHPVFGVGQNAFPLVYPDYRAEDVNEPNISHLHNNFLELAAERGLVGLAAWIWLWGAVLWAAARAWMTGAGGGEKTALAASAAGIIAFLAAGMFEYNFGDSEIQMMFYMTLAMASAAAGRTRDRAADLA